MKTIINTIYFLLLFFSVNSKVNGQALFSLEPDYHYVIPYLPDTIFAFDSYSSWSNFETISEETIYLKWQVVEPEDCPDEWQFLVGDTQQHWSSYITTNIDSSINFIHPMPLNPDWPNNTFELAVWPNQVKGCCTVQVLFSLADDPDNILEIVTYDIAMLDSSCFISAQKEVMGKDQLLISPNPASESFQVAAPKPIVSIRLFDVMGSLVSTTAEPNQSQVIVSGMPNGTYFLQIALQDGRMLYEKLVVQH